MYINHNSLIHMSCVKKFSLSSNAIVKLCGLMDTFITCIEKHINLTPPLYPRLVDGESYFSQVAEALIAAKEEIYITDWM